MIIRAKEKFPDAKPRVISDNGGQFIAKDFHQFIRFLELDHIRTSVAYPKSNGKIKIFHKSIGVECLSRNSFITEEYTREIISKYIDYYNKIRLHSALGYLTPEDFLFNRQEEKFMTTERKLMDAALKREQYWETNASETYGAKTSQVNVPDGSGQALAKLSGAGN